MSDFHDQTSTEFPQADFKRRRFWAIWLIPIFAAFIAGYLTLRAYHEHGPLITVTFNSADDIVPGQTQVRYKSVSLGTVETVRLKPDLSGVQVRVRMASSAEPLLTDHARFWVVKPRLNSIGMADLQTLVGGAYIQLEPGQDGGNSTRTFTGLENPPTDRTDQQGRNFTLNAPTLGSLGIGSPVYYRGIEAGEVLDYNVGDGFGPIAIKVFVHAPYDRYVRQSSQFWNVSGLSLDVGPGGVRLATNSLRAVLSGGVAFATPTDAAKEDPAATNTAFQLYSSKDEAEAAQFRIHVPYAAYFDNSVKALGVGSPVVIYGIQVGAVTDVKLVFDPLHNAARARVAFDIQPDRVFGTATLPNQTSDMVQIVRRLVENGMRVKLDSANLLLGQKMLTLEFQPNAPPAELVQENGVTVLPAQSGSGGDIMSALGDVANKLNQIPFDQIGQNLNHLLTSTDKTISNPELQQSIHSLSIAMANIADLSQKAEKGLTPSLQKLPDISQQLQDAVAHANGLMAGLDNGNAKRVLDQVNDAARSIRLLADFLERHPEVLLSGKTPTDPPGTGP